MNYTILEGKERTKALKEFAIKELGYKIAKYSDCECLMCDQFYAVSEIKVVKYDDGKIDIHCKDWPKCTGSIENLVI